MIRSASMRKLWKVRRTHWAPVFQMFLVAEGSHGQGCCAVKKKSLYLKRTPVCDFFLSNGFKPITSLWRRFQAGTEGFQTRSEHLARLRLSSNVHRDSRHIISSFFGQTHPFDQCLFRSSFNFNTAITNKKQFRRMMMMKKIYPYNYPFYTFFWGIF